MTMKKLLERIDSIERKRTTTLTEGVRQSATVGSLKEFFGDENDFGRGSGRRRPDIRIKYLLGQDFLVMIDGEKYSLSVINLEADLKDEYKHLYDQLYDSRMRVKPEYLVPKYWDLQIAHTEFSDVEGNRPDEDTVEQVIEIIETNHRADLAKVYTFHQKTNEQNPDFYEVTYQKPSPMKISDFVNKNQDSGASAVPGLDKQQLGTAINQYFDKILSYDDSGLTVLDRIAKVWDSLFTKHNGNIDSIIDNEPADVLMKVIQEFKQVLAALGRGLKESRSTTKKSKNQRQGMKEGDWGWDDPQYDRQPPERPDDMDAFKQDRQRRADDAKLDTKKSKNQRQGVAEGKTVKESKAKPDYIDLDGDGDRKEAMKKAAADKKKHRKVSENVHRLLHPHFGNPNPDYMNDNDRVSDLISAINKIKNKNNLSDQDNRDLQELEKMLDYYTAQIGTNAADARLNQARRNIIAQRQEQSKIKQVRGAAYGAAQQGIARMEDLSKTQRKQSNTVVKESWTDFDDAKRAHEKAGSTVTGRPEDYTVTMADGTRKRFITKDSRRKIETLPPVAARRDDDEDDAPAKKTAKSADKKAEPAREGGKKRGRPAGSKNKKKVSEMNESEFHQFMRGVMLIEERMSPEQKAEKERIVKGMKKSSKDLKKRYGGRWQDVMHATATKKAMDSKKK